MPFSIGRLRFGRNTTTNAPGSLQTPVTEDVKRSGDVLRASSMRTPIASPRSRFSSWISRVRSRKERGANLPAGRPPTPTPHLALASSAATKDATMKTLRRIRSQTTGSVDTPKKDEADEDDDEDEDEEESMTDAERARLSSFASGLRGLIAQLQLADEQSRSMPPMKNAEGTPLSPITETEELEPEPELDLVPQLITKAPSIDEVTNLDYGGSLDDLELEEEEEEDLGEDLTPTWHPDVADLVESETPVCRRKSLPCLPSLRSSVAFDEEGRVDDAVIERELALDSEVAAECGVDTETEDELEYFSAASLPTLSEGEDEGQESDTTSGTGFGLCLCGLDLAHPPSAIPDVSADTLLSESSSDNLRPLEGETLSPATPRPLHRHHLPSQPQPAPQSKAESDPVTSKSRRKRAATLPAVRERVLPALPPLSIPTTGSIGPRERSQDVGELLRTVAHLQREKARLEQALASANLRIEQQDGQLEYLTAQIASLRRALMRLARVDSDSDSEKDTEQSIPIIVRAPYESPDADADADEEADAGVVTSAPAVKDGANPLSTPPATPDRRAAAALSEAADADEERRSVEDTSLLCTPKPARGLVRRKSAGATSALSELGIGRAQVKRRAGSADLKTLTTSLPWP